VLHLGLGGGVYQLFTALSCRSKPLRRSSLSPSPRLARRPVVVRHAGVVGTRGGSRLICRFPVPRTRFGRLSECFATNVSFDMRATNRDGGRSGRFYAPNNTHTTRKGRQREGGKAGRCFSPLGARRERLQTARACCRWTSNCAGMAAINHPTATSNRPGAMSVAANVGRWN